MFKKYNLRSYNYALVTLVVITSVFGLLIINSADSSYTVKQAGGIVMALLWMTFLSFVDYHFILKYYRVLYILLVLLLVGVKLFGVSAGGATRWLGSGAFRIQPSEMGKLMLILFLAQLLYTNKGKLNSWKFLVFVNAILAVPLLLIVSQPDLSQTILLFLIMFVVLYTAGFPYKKLGKIMMVAVPVVVGLFIYIQNPDQKLLRPYQWRRVMAFIDPASYDDNVYQQKYAVQAIGSGGLTGKGLGNDDPSSLLNSNYIAEAHTDFVFAALGEQLGFIGSIIAIGLLAAIVFVCIHIAIKTRDYAGRLVVIGIASYIGFQTFFNIGVVTQLLPNTGLALPFFSYGLSSLITLYTSMGIVLNISLQNGQVKDKDLFISGIVDIEEVRDDEKKTHRLRL